MSRARILILKPSSLGDVVQALAFLRMLRRQLPNAEIYWWIDVDLASLLEGDADLNGLFLFRRRRWASPRHWPEVVEHVRLLRRGNFDWVIDLQALARSGVLAWLLGAGLTIGLDDPREGATAFYDLRVPRPTPHTHAVDWYLEVLRRLDIPLRWDFEWLPARPAVADAVRRKWPGEGFPWLAVQPGARWLNKRWPIEHYADLIRRLARARPNLRFCVLGGPADRELGAILDGAVPGRCLDLTGQTSLPELVEWIRRSQLLVTNDSGPMHIAAALGTPVVALFGPTDPRRTGPYRRPEGVLRHPLPCSPCMRSRCHYAKGIECLRGLEPGRVYAHVMGQLTSML